MANGKREARVTANGEHETENAIVLLGHRILETTTHIKKLSVPGGSNTHAHAKQGQPRRIVSKGTSQVHCSKPFLALHGWITATGEKLHDCIAENMTDVRVQNNRPSKELHVENTHSQ